jgi:hypothetical protein
LVSGFRFKGYAHATHDAWQAGIRFLKVSSSIKLAAFQASDGNDTSYKTSRSWNGELIERRTSNVQLRTSNIDGATLYLF